MPLPAGVETVTVSSGEPLSLPDGGFIQGKLVFSGPDLVTIGADDVILGGTVEARLVDGEFTIELVATDAVGMSPTGWTYKVTAQLTNAPSWTRHISLPSADASVVLADIIVPDPVTGEYATLVDLDGVTAEDVGADPAGSAAAAQTAAATDATTKVAAHAGAADPHGDRAFTTAAVSTHAGAADPHGDRAAATADLATHAADTTSVHGITDTAALETGAGAQGKADAAQAAAISAAATDATTKAAAAQAAAIADAVTKYLQLVGGTVTGAITSARAASTDTAFAGSVTGDGFDRVRILESGLLEVGPGNAARDTNWRRSAANEWTTDDALIVALMLRHLGTTLGFYGAAATTKPAVTGSRGGNAALASLITALATLGLVTDSTTA